MRGCKMTFCVVVLAFCLQCGTDAWVKKCKSKKVEIPDFGYIGKEGPKYWPESFASCGGFRQSPIALSRGQADPVTLPDLLYIGHAAFVPQSYSVTNAYSTVELHYLSHQKPVLMGGPFCTNYTLAEIHFHWGKSANQGSEHTLENRRYGMETHLVHFKTEYGNADVAATHEDGFAVVALLFVVQDDDNPDLVPLVRGVKKVREGGSSTRLPGDALWWLGNQLTSSRYYTYHGSLTTPPCLENVEWIVQQRKATIGIKQLREFQTLRGYNGEPILSNVRPLQPRYGRQVRFDQ